MVGTRTSQDHPQFRCGCMQHPRQWYPIITWNATSTWAASSRDLDCYWMSYSVCTNVLDSPPNSEHIFLYIRFHDLILSTCFTCDPTPWPHYPGHRPDFGSRTAFLPSRCIAGTGILPSFASVEFSRALFWLLYYLEILTDSIGFWGWLTYVPLHQSECITVKHTDHALSVPREVFEIDFPMPLDAKSMAKLKCFELVWGTIGMYG